jgi:hypothetical protein
MGSRVGRYWNWDKRQTEIRMLYPLQKGWEIAKKKCLSSQATFNAEVMTVRGVPCSA